MCPKNRWNEVLAWGKGIPDLLVFSAVASCRHAVEIYQLMRFVRGEKGALKATRSFSQTEWLQCYRDPQIAIRGAFAEFGIEVAEGEIPEWEFPEEMLSQLRIYEEEFKHPATRKGAIDGIARTIAKPFFEHDAATLIELLDATDDEDIEDESICEAIALNIHCRFYIEVLLPCLIEYKQRPDVLFLRAKNGDLKALEMLIRLDKWAISFPEWMETMYSGDHIKDGIVRRTIAKAMDKPPTGTIDVGSIKLEIAALVSRQFQALGLELDAREIRALFDILAKMDHGLERDHHLPPDNGNLGTHIRRKKTRWKAYMPDMPKEIQKAMRSCYQQQVNEGKAQRRKAG